MNLSKETVRSIMELTLNEKGDIFFKKILKAQKNGLFAYIPIMAFTILYSLAKFDFKVNILAITIPAIFVTYLLIYVPGKAASILKKAVLSINTLDDSTIEITCSETFWSKEAHYSFSKSDLDISEVYYIHTILKVDPTYLLKDKQKNKKFYFFPGFFIENTEINALLSELV